MGVQSLPVQSSFSFVYVFTFRGLPATGPHHHLQSRLWKADIQLRQRHESSMWDIVGSKGLTTVDTISFFRRHNGPVQYGNEMQWFSRDCCREWSKRGGRIVWSALSGSWLPDPTSSSSVPPRMFDVNALLVLSQWLPRCDTVSAVALFVTVSGQSKH